MKNNRYPVVYITAILVGMAVIFSCVHQPQPQLVSFKSDLLPVFQTKCALNSGCHLGTNAGNQHIDFTDSAAYITLVNKHLLNVMNPSGSILYAEVQSKAMPKFPDSPLSFAEQQIILQWLEQGARNN
jgi:hypothetical protein